MGVSQLSPCRQTALQTALDEYENLEWRHHGTGLLQAYIPSFDNFRLHIWNRKNLLFEGMRESGAIHNHRFELHSEVLIGSLTHTHVFPSSTVENEPRMFSLWRIEGASKGSTDEIRPCGHCDASFEATHRYAEGDHYSVPLRAFHYARQEEDDTEYTITLVELIDKVRDEAALILTPYGRAPVHAFARQAPQAVQRHVIAKARLLLEGVGGG